jgi:hypothetical protein
VYSREIDGEILTLGANGWTYDFTIMLYDYETESIWYPMDDELVCISGKYADRKLKMYKATTDEWNDWKKDNPDTGFLDVGK